MLTRIPPPDLDIVTRYMVDIVNVVNNRVRDICEPYSLPQNPQYTGPSFDE